MRELDEAAIVRRERVRACRIAELERKKILQAANDPSWTEHLANVQTAISDGDYSVQREGINEAWAS